MNKNLFCKLLAWVIFSIFSSFTQAAAVYDFASSPIRFGDSNVSVGFQFTANKNLSVSSLGFYDHHQDGFVTPHDVGIFDSNGNLLKAVTLAAGTAGALEGKFRYATITPFTLSAGQSYIIAGLATGEDGYTYGNVGTTIQGLTIDPAITIGPLASLFLYAPTFTFPTDKFIYDLYPMVNFKFNNLSSVPVPAAFPLLGFALAGLGGMQRSFSRKRACINNDL